MKKIFLFVITLLFFWSSCTKEEKPTLTDETMVSVLVDLHIAEAAMLSANRKGKDTLAQKYYGQIFSMHGVVDSVFYKDLDLMARDPKRVEAIYQQVMDEIEKLDLEKNEEDEQLERENIPVDPEIEKKK